MIAKVPFADVISTMSDPTIPLTTLEFTQWGNPEDETYFVFMLSYSPYDKIRQTTYPDILITTGLNDLRVAYWEPTKFPARLHVQAEPANLILHMPTWKPGTPGHWGAKTT